MPKLGPYQALLLATAVLIPALARAQEEAPNERPAFVFSPEMLDSMDQFPGDLGPLPLPEMPPENLLTEERVRLGEKLFFDTRLSEDSSVSCASCHQPTHGFADPARVSRGAFLRVGRRNSPTLFNVAYQSELFWDGRAGSLEEQSLIPMFSAVEMSLPKDSNVLEVMQSEEEYGRLSRMAYGGDLTLQIAAKALAAYERTLVTIDTPFDRYAGGDRSALTESQKRGMVLFFGKAACTQCHNGSLFSDKLYHNLGFDGEDLGRFEVTGIEADRAAFRTPQLRNVTITAPYMHDGSMTTLEEVIKFYEEGGGPREKKSDLLNPFTLSDTERRDLIEFLESLDGGIVNPKLLISRSPGSDASQSPKQASGTGAIKAAMAGAINEEYTFISFMLGHQRELDADMLEEVGDSARRLGDHFGDISTLSKTHWDDEDKTFFRLRSKVLESSARQLDSLADKGDKEALYLSFSELDRNCTTCHVRFRPDLDWNTAPR